MSSQGRVSFSSRRSSVSRSPCISPLPTSSPLTSAILSANSNMLTSIATHMRYMYYDTLYTDVIFRMPRADNPESDPGEVGFACDSDEIAAHRIILVSTSPYLSRLCAECERLDRIPVITTAYGDAETFRLIKRWLYLRDVSLINSSNDMTMRRAAIIYTLPELETAVAAIIGRPLLDVPAACGFLTRLFGRGLEWVSENQDGLQCALTTLCFNGERLNTHEELFQRLPFEVVRLLLSSDDLCACEETVFTLFLRWAGALGESFATTAQNCNNYIGITTRDDMIDALLALVRVSTLPQEMVLRELGLRGLLTEQRMLLLQQRFQTAQQQPQSSTGLLAAPGFRRQRGVMAKVRRRSGKVFAGLSSGASSIFKGVASLFRGRRPSGRIPLQTPRHDHSRTVSDDAIDEEARFSALPLGTSGRRSFSSVGSATSGEANRRSSLLARSMSFNERGISVNELATRARRSITEGDMTGRSAGIGYNETSARGRKSLTEEEMTGRFRGMSAGSTADADASFSAVGRPAPMSGGDDDGIGAEEPSFTMEEAAVEWGPRAECLELSTLISWHYNFKGQVGPPFDDIKGCHLVGMDVPCVKPIRAGGPPQSFRGTLLGTWEMSHPDGEPAAIQGITLTAVRFAFKIVSFAAETAIFLGVCMQEGGSMHNVYKTGILSDGRVCDTAAVAMDLDDADTLATRVVNFEAGSIVSFVYRAADAMMDCFVDGIYTQQLNVMPNAWGYPLVQISGSGATLVELLSYEAMVQHEPGIAIVSDIPEETTDYHTEDDAQVVEFDELARDALDDPTPH